MDDMEQLDHHRKSAEMYLMGQLRVGPEAIVHVEMIQREWVGPNEYMIWDCHTLSDGRWWVIAPFMNLYSQDDFKSADYTLSFHVGLTERMSWKGDGPPAPKDGLEGVDALFRQFEDAGQKADQSLEVSDVQGAAIACREVLITLVAELAAVKVEVAERCASIQRGNFVDRSAVAAEVLAAGSRNKQLRAHLKQSANSAWRYVNWLAHDSKGTAAEAQFGASLTQRVVMDFIHLILEHDRESAFECLQCRSRSVGSDSDYRDDGLLSWYVCEKCGWESEPEWSEYPKRSLESRAATDSPDTPCTAGSDGPGK